MDITHSIRAEQHRLLYQQAPRTIPFHAAACTLITLALWPLLPTLWLLGWWAAAVAVAVVRWRQARAALEEPGEDGDPSEAEGRYGLGVAANALVWALGFGVFAQTLPAEFTVLFVLVLAALCAGALVFSYGVKGHFLTFVIPILLVPALHGLTEGSAVGVWTGVLALLYLGALVLAFERHSRMLNELIRTRIENARLVETLRTSNDELSSSNERLRELSSTDGLTRIANRRHFDQVLQREWARAQRAGSSLAYLMVDIDSFKPFNDHYGHLEGDECLRKVAQALQSILRRPGDFVGRYGGEEFAVISPDTPPEGAETLGEKIRSGLEALQIPHATSPTADHVTVSIGVCAVTPTEGLRLSDLIKSADNALYQAKRKGRNQVVLGPYESDAE